MRCTVGQSPFEVEEMAYSIREGLRVTLKKLHVHGHVHVHVLGDPKNQIKSITAMFSV